MFEAKISSYRGRIKGSTPLNRVASSKLSDSVEFSVPVFASVVVIAARELDEHRGLVADRSGVVAGRQQHHGPELGLAAVVHADVEPGRRGGAPRAGARSCRFRA
jgi:hypothetical protein